MENRLVSKSVPEMRHRREPYPHLISIASTLNLAHTGRLGGSPASASRLMSLMSNVRILNSKENFLKKRELVKEVCLIGVTSACLPTCRRRSSRHSTRPPPPLCTKLSCIPSRMANERDVQCNQMLPNASVTVLLWPVTNSNGDPAQVPRHRKAQDEGGSIPSIVLILVKRHPGTVLKSPNREVYQLR